MPKLAADKVKGRSLSLVTLADCASPVGCRRSCCCWVRNTSCKGSSVYMVLSDTPKVYDRDAGVHGCMASVCSNVISQKDRVGASL